MNLLFAREGRFATPAQSATCAPRVPATRRADGLLFAYSSASAVTRNLPLCVDHECATPQAGFGDRGASTGRTPLTTVTRSGGKAPAEPYDFRGGNLSDSSPQIESCPH